jgi:alkanesulfonate monooxygenase SsuD/methylene tetrahydromethanopterin reductase-like flavin-dependent oxidoreductase (luciferase family)
MDVDIILEPDVSPGEMAEIGEVAEAYGIRALWASNYHTNRDAFLSLVPVARVTRKLLLGALAISPFEMHPIKIANSLLTLNELCGGRALIVIGAGEGLTEAIGVAKPPRIVRAVREALEIVIGAARNELGSGYDGEIFQVRFPCNHAWAPVPGPGVFAGAMGAQMITMSARVADGIQLGDMPIERMPGVQQNIADGMGRRSEPPADFRLGNFFGWHIKPDRETAFREARRELALRGRQLHNEFISHLLDPKQCQVVRDNYPAFMQAWQDRSGEIQGVSDEIVLPLIHGMTATGDLNDLDREIERFRLFGSLGLTEISLRLHDAPMEALKIIGEQVVPALR